MSEATTQRLGELRAAGQRFVEAGDLTRALATYDEALELARRAELSEQVDLALCNRAAMLIGLQQGEGEVARLREILLRSSDPTNCRLAAYNVSLHYEQVGESKKSLFYARIALERARQLERPEWIASSLNQIGNSLLADSHVAEATQTYEQALELMPRREAVARCRVLNNLGYCRLLENRLADGFAMLYEALRTLRRLGNERYRRMVHLDLCYGLLEVNKLGAARRHGLEALRLAEAAGHDEGQKNALYLLGEAANLGGDEGEASRCFERLQARYFPDSAFLPGFLLSIDVRKLVNLHA